MKQINRRSFIKGLGATLAVPMLGFPALGRAKSAARVVVVGGGFGGATCAKYLKRFDTALDVTLVTPEKTYITCPFSNAVLGGLRSMESISHSNDKLASVHGVKLLHDVVTAIDPVKKSLQTAGGKTLEYDKLVLSPGIDFRWGALEGYDQAASDTMPHAWKAGPQTVLLRKQLEAMPDGGLVVMSAPANPFRCPPGPYERASMIAHYLKQSKPKSKVLLLDTKDNFSKQALFQDAWAEFYPDHIEWVPGSQGGKLARVDAATNTVYTADGESFKAAVANIIPPQKAAQIAEAAGLLNESGWCAVNQQTFESAVHKDVHVIGDACIAGKMPKSGYSANSQAKVCAAGVVAALRGETLGTTSWINTCYSQITPDYGISVADVYRLGPEGITPVEGAGGVGPRDADRKTRFKEARFAEGWYQSIVADTLG